MPIQLLRVDDRLIHGQVVVGWGSKLHPDQYVVVDDALMASEWERELYALGAPTGVEVRFVSVETARSSLEEWAASEQKTILLLRDTESLHRLGEGGLLSGRAVNLGGIHHRAEAERVLPYLYLDDADRERLLDLARGGAAITAQDLPGSKAVKVRRLLREVS